MTTSDPTLAAVEAVRDDLRDLRTDLTVRMDGMVTRREHEAEVRRIDSEHRMLAASHHALVRSADVEHAELRTDIEADKAERRVERQRAEDSRRADRRTYMTVTVASIGVAVSGAAVVVNAVTGT